MAHKTKAKLIITKTTKADNPDEADKNLFRFFEILYTADQRNKKEQQAELVKETTTQDSIPTKASHE